jgi:hypothetical protein
MNFMNTKTRRGTVVLAGALAAVSLAACGTKEISADDAAKDVKLNVLTPRGITATVTCPDKTKAEKDKTIKCTVKDSDGNRGTVVATIEDDKGKLGGYTSDVKKLQLAVIEKNAAETGASKGISGKVNCPSSTEPKKGAVFFCTAKITGSGFGVVLVRQTDAASKVDVTVQKRKLRTRQIEGNIRSALTKRGITATVTCPAKVTSQKGSTFTCTIKAANGRSLKVVATQKDSEGNFSLDVQK